MKKSNQEDVILSLSNVVLILSISSIVFLLFFPLISNFLYSWLYLVNSNFVIIPTEVGLPGIRSQLDTVGIASFFLFSIVNIVIVYIIFTGGERRLIIVSIIITAILSLILYMFIMIIYDTIYRFALAEGTGEELSFFALYNWTPESTMIPLIIIFIITYVITLNLINKMYGDKIRKKIETEKKVVRKI